MGTPVERRRIDRQEAPRNATGCSLAALCQTRNDNRNKGDSVHPESPARVVALASLPVPTATQWSAQDVCASLTGTESVTLVPTPTALSI